MRARKVLTLTCIIFGIGSLSISNAFSDVPVFHWAYDRVKLMQAQEILSGFEDGTFRPNDLITREQFATILSKTVEKANITLPVNEEFNIEANVCVDIKDRWSYKYINKAFNIMGPKYTDSISNKVYFCPEKTMTREEVAKILVKVFNKKILNKIESEQLLTQFSDHSKISNEYIEYVGTAVKEEIIVGKGRYFDPEGNLTRAEISVLMSKFIEPVKEEVEKLIVIYNDGKFGYSDDNSNVVIPCIYDIAWDFSDKLALVRREGKYGYINEKGEEIIPCIYEYGRIEEGFAILIKDDNIWYLDKKNKVMKVWQYDSTWIEFKEGLAIVSKNGKYGYIDNSGNEVIECIYDDAGKFEAGKAKVVTDGKEMTIDKNGEYIN